ncbi:TetR/AcrR family transcriptional regulator C-terminal domain-containing protein [Actinomadura pelletieri]|uniref:TetR/AcrR family transcriptional regulator C-terminal domain-containing protein n=1 Tax=Actinomadura pelletieri TaxID=111805 RepID=UPI001FE727A4|nr:TetR/AcrR family transcriptional regulator C-terminal domain-containing protein [Actinomadura pelletieri]
MTLAAGPSSAARHESWSTTDEEDPSPAGNIVDGLSTIGRRYAELLSRAQMTDLVRIVIAELPRFPELAHAQFSHGKMPYFESDCCDSVRDDRVNNLVDVSPRPGLPST